MSNYDIKDINQAEGGRRRMDWAERETEGSQSPDLASHAPAVGFPCCSTLSRVMPASMLVPE